MSIPVNIPMMCPFDTPDAMQLVYWVQYKDNEELMGVMPGFAFEEKDSGTGNIRVQEVYEGRVGEDDHRSGSLKALEEGLARQAIKQHREFWQGRLKNVQDD